MVVGFWRLANRNDALRAISGRLNGLSGVVVPKKLGTSFLDHKRSALPFVRFFHFVGLPMMIGGGGVIGNPRSLAVRIHVGYPQVGAGLSFAVE